MLKENNRREEFECNSMFYCVVKSKLPLAMVSHYKRWLLTEKKDETLEAISLWLATEVHVHIEAKEEVEGFDKLHGSNFFKIKYSKFRKVRP